MYPPCRKQREGDMEDQPFDRETWAIVLVGWMLALWLTLM
jgi:hypothetical protein